MLCGLGLDAVVDVVVQAVDSEDSAILRETRATYLPTEGEMPEWEAQEAEEAADKAVSGRGGRLALLKCGWILGVLVTSCAARLWVAMVLQSGCASSGGLGFLSKYFNRITGNSELTAEDLDPVLEEMRTSVSRQQEDEPTGPP